MNNDKTPRECITHHHACDCRERLFEQTKQELETVKTNRKYHVENYQGVCKELEASRLQIKDLTSALEDLLNYSYLHAGEKAKETLKKLKQK